MKRTVLNKRYAEALADAAEESGDLRTVGSELNALADALAENAQFRTFTMTARKSRDEKKKLLNALSEKIGLSTLTRRLLSHLVDKKRLAILGGLAEAFAEAADRRLGIVTARVTSAVPLTDAQRERILTRLEQRTNKKIRLIEDTDQSLVSGFQVSLDGSFYDGSLRGELSRIRERIAHGA